ncbi:unnamed protein product [Lampetra planeri]
MSVEMVKGSSRPADTAGDCASGEFTAAAPTRACCAQMLGCLPGSVPGFVVPGSHVLLGGGHGVPFSRASVSPRVSLSPVSWASPLSKMEVRLLLRTALAVTLLASLSLAQQESHNECLSRNAKSCGECIQVGSRCAWCTMSNFTGVGESNSARCDYAENLKERKCDERHVESPRGQVHVLRNTPVSDQGTKLPPENITQLAPQHVRLTLRAGECRTDKPSVVVPSESAWNRPVGSDQAALGTEIHSSWDDDDNNNSSSNNSSSSDDDNLDNGDIPEDGGVDEPDDGDEVEVEEEKAAEEVEEEEDARVLRSLDPILITIITVSSLGVLLGAACTGLLLYCACTYGGGVVGGTGGRRHHFHQQQQLNRSHGGGGGRCVPELSISALERYNFELYDGAARAKEKKTPCIREAGGAGQLAEEKARLHTQGSSSEA